MKPGRSRGLWEWECGQREGRPGRERWCPHSSVADNLRARPHPLKRCLLSREAPFGSAALGPGSEGKGEGAHLSIVVCQAPHLLLLPFVNQEVDLASRCMMAIPASVELVPTLCWASWEGSFIHYCI